MSLTPHDIAKMLDHSTLQPYLDGGRRPPWVRAGAALRLRERVRPPLRRADPGGNAQGQRREGLHGDRLPARRA